MNEHHADVVIIGAGIAGLWTFQRLTRMGFDVLLLESGRVGGGQTIASQGIIHSGLKYALASRVSAIAEHIRAMPQRWREALAGSGDVDLSGARLAAESQQLLIPRGIVGGVVKTFAKNMLGRTAREIAFDDWPESIRRSGFRGAAIDMNEPVVDVASVIRALAACRPEAIRAARVACRTDATGAIKSIQVEGRTIRAKCFIFTCAHGNQPMAKAHAHDRGLATQARPLLMGLLRPAPYPMFAHLVGKSEKPVATITTHRDHQGQCVWYIGGQVAERKKECAPTEVRDALRKAFAQYLPEVNIRGMEWGTFAIDRSEGRSSSNDWLSDTPTIHAKANALYCWPTKLAFAPLLADRIVEQLSQRGIAPSHARHDWTFLPAAPFAEPPWNEATWKSDA